MCLNLTPLPYILITAMWIILAWGIKNSGCISSVILRSQRLQQLPLTPPNQHTEWAVSLQCQTRCWEPKLTPHPHSPAALPLFRVLEAELTFWASRSLIKSMMITIKGVGRRDTLGLHELIILDHAPAPQPRTRGGFHLEDKLDYRV